MSKAHNGEAARSSEDLLSRLESDHSDLIDLYRRMLRKSIFTNRSELRPNRLEQLAADESDDLLRYLRQPDREQAVRHGADLCEAGLGEESVLGLGEATRQFFLSKISHEPVVPAIRAIDEYLHAVIQGFMRGRGQAILNEQERIRSALQRTLGRYSLQMEVAASLAGVTTSILDLDILVTTAVELIRERFDLYYVGLFLTDESRRWAMLRAGTGEAGREMLRRGHLFEVDSNSLVSKCVVSGEPWVILDVGRDDTFIPNPLLPDTLSEAVIPLRTRGKVIGAVTAQSRQVAAFSDLDVTALRILADQLANAIENARLFTELRRSEEKYRTLLDNIEEGYYELDMDGRYTFVNDALADLIHAPKNKILGSNFQQFIDPEYAERVKQAYQAAFELGGAVHGIEYKIRSKEGSSRFVETSALLSRSVMGEMTGLRGIVRDITARKQAEQYQIERKALERSNKELEQFASVASHDLQEPLRKIQILGDRLNTLYGESLNDEGRGYLDRMRIAANRSQKLIEDLLSLSRVETQGQPFVRVDLAKVTKDVAADLEERIAQVGGSVVIGELPVVEADPAQMRQLLQNLILNGLKFHQPEQKPQITVFGRILDAKPRSVKTPNAEALCQIFVEDDGIGFDEKYLDRIFQPFQRLHSGKEYEGTGIGLSICRRIAERHGGEITANSQPGQGSTFIVTLKVHHSNETKP
jgi:PAS domain S-box-containing protein